ncbi:GAF sensor signal transduction histidine kinase [Stanieria cyanosphaera PCC 7437]|uniref:histidine kinase n=1 Tax=Stanieria cyanosphaera (strain ATCC 29371 / PCC 7437) TaxID=111780 RepID=K9XZT3_STAC7|nr:GAF domain-containing sensor histidine kinase [Stanieria cyanosphaera]AFZ37631.1 GAF sensor signal transduction histidine kinase [Stanieria cyanosphaera PCC 7437]
MPHLAESYQIKEQIIQVILTDSNSQTILSHIAGQIGNFFQVDGCAVIYTPSTSANNSQIGIWSGQNFTLDCQAILDFYQQFEHRDSDRDQGMEVSCTHNPLSSCGLHLFKDSLKKSFASADLSKESLSWLTIEEREKFPIQALLGMVINDRVKGAILLFKSQPYQWNSSEHLLLQSVSESVVIAFSQIQLQQQAQLKTRYQTLLNHLSREMSQISDLNSLLNLTLAEIGKALGVDRGLIFMLKYKDPLLAQKNRHRLKATVQLNYHWLQQPSSDRHKLNYSFNLTDSAWLERAIQQAPQPLAISDHAVFPDFSDPNLPEFFRAENSSSLLIMPLMGSVTSESQSSLVLGFLVLQQNQPRLWLSDELDLINWIAIQISTSLIHQQTLTQVQSIVEERTAQLKWSLDVQAKLSEKMRQQIDQLRQLNELKDDFLSSMSHELKTPLTSMKIAIKMLRQPQLSEELREKYLNILEQEWHREYNLIKDLLTLQQVESGEFSFHPQELNLNQIIGELAEAFTKKWQFDKGLTLKTNLSDSELKFYTDSESLQHILTELLLNAGKYSDPDTTIDLQAECHPTLQGQTMTIVIVNRGAGITPEELPHIFDKFRRGKGVTNRAVPGTGLGLALVKYLVEHLNGSIEVTSEPVEHSTVFLTTFTIKLPQLQIV